MRRLIPIAALAVLTALLLVPFHPETGLLDVTVGAIPASDLEARWLLWNVIETGGNFVAFVLAGWAALVVVRRAWLAALICCAISAIAETAQIFIPNRVASLADFATNAAGAVIGVAVLRTAQRVRSARASRRAEAAVV